jgi:hypothetical protein
MWDGVNAPATEVRAGDTESDSRRLTGSTH